MGSGNLSGDPGGWRRVETVDAGKSCKGPPALPTLAACS